MIINIIPKRRLENRIEYLARQLLLTGVDNGDNDILDMAIKIAHDEKLDVMFKLPNDTVINTDLAYRIRYERGLSLRTG